VGWERALDGGAVWHEMGCMTGKTATAEQRAHVQPHAMGKHVSGRYFERDGETQGSRPVGPRRPRKRRQTPAPTIIDDQN
jgi:hypothetical protein